MLSTNFSKDKNLFRILDLCLECKACKSECPSNVDMAKLKLKEIYGHSNMGVYLMPLTDGDINENNIIKL